MLGGHTLGSESRVKVGGGNSPSRHVPSHTRRPCSKDPLGSSCVPGVRGSGKSKALGITPRVGGVTCLFPQLLSGGLVFEETSERRRCSTQRAALREEGIFRCCYVLGKRKSFHPQKPFHYSPRHDSPKYTSPGRFLVPEQGSDFHSGTCQRFTSDRGRTKNMGGRLTLGSIPPSTSIVCTRV